MSAVAAEARYIAHLYEVSPSKDRLERIEERIQSTIDAEAPAIAARALRELAAGMREMMTNFPHGGRHTRAGWALAVMDARADEIERGAS